MCKFLALGQEWSASGGQVGWGHVWKCFISRRVRGRAVIRAGCRPAAGDADTPILQFFPNMSSVMLLFYRDCVTWHRCRLLKSSQLLVPGQLPQVVSSPPHRAGGDTTRGGTEGFAPARCCETWQESPAHEARSHAQPMGTARGFPSFPSPGGWARGGKGLYHCPSSTWASALATGLKNKCLVNVSGGDALRACDTLSCVCVHGSRPRR